MQTTATNSIKQHNKRGEIVYRYALLHLSNYLDCHANSLANYTCKDTVLTLASVNTLHTRTSTYTQNHLITLTMHGAR